MQLRSREIGWLTAASLLLVLASSLPHIAGHLAETNDRIFNGAVFDRQDQAVYLAMMHAGEAGEWAYRYRFTAEEQEGAYVRQYYLTLGRLARLFPGEGHLRLTDVFEDARWVSGLAMCAAVLMLFTQLFESIFARRFGFLLAVTSSGFGWLQLLTGLIPDPGISPIDFWLFDAYPFFGLITFPHFTSVIGLLAVMIALFLSDLRAPASWKAAGVILAGPAAVWIQPFAPLLADVAMIGAFFSAWLAPQPGIGASPAAKRSFPWRPFAVLAAAGLAQAPLLIYNLSVFRSDPVMAAFAGQNVTLSPPPVYYLLGFGPAGLLALWAGLARRVNLSRPGAAAMLAWAAAAPVLAYLPWAYQRRFMLAYTIPISALAVWGLRYLWQRGSAAAWIRAKQPIWAFLFLFAASLSSLALVLGFFARMAARPDESFDPAPVVRAADWLVGQAGEDDVALAARVETSRLLAARAGLQVYWGHPIETLDASAKEALVARFFAGELDADWVAGQGVDWVLVEGAAPPGVAGLAQVYDDDGVRLYRVNR